MIRELTELGEEGQVENRWFVTVVSARAIELVKTSRVFDFAALMFKTISVLFRATDSVLIVLEGVVKLMIRFYCVVDGVTHSTELRVDVVSRAICAVADTHLE